MHKKIYAENVNKLVRRVSLEHHIPEEDIRKILYETYEDSIKDSKLRFFLKNFNPKKGDVILDVGCFVGTHINILSKKYPECKFIGYDISQEYINLAKTAHGSQNASFVCDDVLKTKKLESNSIDHIFFFEVLEHVDCPRSFIELFHRLLKKDGRLYLSTPSALGITNVMLNIRNRSLKYIETEPRNTGTEKDHIYIWDKLTLFRLLNRCGFNHEKLFVSRKYSLFSGQSLCFIVKK